MKLFRNNHGVASPLEFSIASMALISTIVFVTASMAPPVELDAAQFHADAGAKACEILNLLLTSDSEIGLVIDSAAPVPIPLTESIIDITITNTPPDAIIISPENGATDIIPAEPDSYVQLKVYVFDFDGQSMNVSFYEDSIKNGVPDDDDILIGSHNGVLNGERYVDWKDRQFHQDYYWYVTVDDSKENRTSVFCSFSTMDNNPPKTPEILSCEGPFVEPYCIDKECYFCAAADDPEGQDVRYIWDWGDGSPYETTIYYPSGTKIQVKHTWTSLGWKGISVQAEDTTHLFSGSVTKLILIEDCSASTPGTGKCFLSGTQIQMADDTLKNIEDIQIGDLIKSFDVLTNTVQNDKVVKIYHDTPDQMAYDYYLLINNDLRVTPDHQIHVNNQWIKAEDLKIGDNLFKGTVNSMEKIFEKAPSYNFETEKYHNYFVLFGDSILLAHNEETTYVLTGDEEEVSLSRQTSVTQNDYTALLSIEKIYAMSEIPYQELKKMIKLPDYYQFYIIIENSKATYLNYQPDPTVSLKDANVIKTATANVIIVDSVGYAYATITVAVVK